ncbi:MAG: DedA family protein [Pseudomonadota bacterium]
MSDFWNFILEFVKAYDEYILVIAFIICMAESVIGISLFVPSTLILLSFSATLTLSGANGLMLWLCAGLGAALGDWISYALGYYFEDHLHDRWPLKNNKDLLERGHTFFKKWGWLSMFATRFIGPLRSLTPLVAGICAMPLIPFALASSASAFVWAGVILSPGLLGASWLANQ